MLTSTKETRPGPAIPPGTGLGGTGGLATPSRHFGQAYLGKTWTFTSSFAGVNSSSRGEVFADALFGAAAAGAGFLGLGQVVLDAVVGEMVQEVRPRGRAALVRSPAAAVSGSAGAVNSGSQTVSWSRTDDLGLGRL